MVTRLFLVYLIAELTVLTVLVSTIGFGWTVLVLLAAFVVGLVLAGGQARRQLGRLRSGGVTRQGWQNTVSDGALVALGSVLVVVPGLVTSVVGTLTLLPGTRAIVRPGVTALVMGGLGRRAPLITVATVGAQHYASRRREDVIDGEVLDITDVTDAPEDGPAPRPSSW